MIESATTIPQFHLTVDADASALLKSHRDRQRSGRRTSMTALLVKALAGLLERNPPFQCLLEGGSY